VSWITSTVGFVYDFLADDGWELLVGLAIILPVTFAVSARSDRAAGLFMVGGVLLTAAISLGRALPRRSARS
jgi:hypothetical protein